MKRILLVFVMLAVLLAACGNQPSDYPEVDDNIFTEEVVVPPAIPPPTSEEVLPQATSWQEAYAALFRDYAPRMPARHFVLHDINKDNIPELIILIPGVGGNWFTANIYTFTEEGPVQLEIESQLSFHGDFLYAPLGNQPGIIKSPVDGNYYTSLWLMVIDEHRLVTQVNLHRGQYVHYGDELVWEEEHWHINGGSVTEAEFYSVYDSAIGSRDKRVRLAHHAITADSIQNIIFEDGTQTASWQEAYAEILWDYYTAVPPPDEWDRWGFFLHDLDHDGVPEIFLVYIAAGIWSTAIYTYADGEILPIEGNFFSYYGIYPPMGKPGIIIQAYGATDLMVLDEGKLVVELALRRPFMHGDAERWYINDTQVTEEEFTQMYDNIMPVWDSNWYNRVNIWPTNINKENIHEIIFGWS